MYLNPFSSFSKYVLYFLLFLFLNLTHGIFTHFKFFSPISCLTINQDRILSPNHSKFQNRLQFTRLDDNFTTFNCKNNVNSHQFRSVRPSLSYNHLFPTLFSFISHNPLLSKGCKHGYRVYNEILPPGDDTHKMLKDLYLNRDKLFDKSLGKKCNLYRYFNITRENIRQHLDFTMSEYFEKRRKDKERSIYMVDGKAFNGEFDWSLPLPRSMTSYKIPDVSSDPIVPMGSQNTGIEPKFEHEVLQSIYNLIPDPQSNSDKENDSDKDSSKESELVELYDEVGDNDYEVFEDQKLYKKPFFQDVKLTSSEESRKNRENLRKVMRHPTVFPSYIDPENPVHRTGRRRELQRKRDSGTIIGITFSGRLQRLRWNMDIDYKDDISRGNWKIGDLTSKEFNDSIEWEQLMPSHQDNNYFKRSYYEGGFGDEDRTVDNFFDVQFIGSTDAYPFAISAGMQFTWPIYWVPWLCKKNPKIRGQPIRSPVFNLGGVEPLQLWFYPEGNTQSINGYCSLKLISPPGWNLPYRIYLYVFSEYNRVVLGPMYRESAEYVTLSLNTCRLVTKDDKEVVEMRENDKDYVILGPSGNVYVGVGIVDEEIREHKQKFEFKYDWDEGDYDFNQWLKKQTSNPDDQFTRDCIDKE